MTEQRLIEILAENDCYPTDKRIAAVKQAINEAIQECADSAKTERTIMDYYVIDKQSILKLKVK